MKRFFILCLLTFALASCENSLTISDAAQNDLLAQADFVEGTRSTDYQRIVLASGQVVYMDSDSTYFLGDIIFSKEQIEAMNTPQPRGVIPKEPYIKYWPNKVIRYNIIVGFSISQQIAITQALETISNITQIQFRPASASAHPCLVFVPSDTNTSYIGMQTNGNNIKLCLSDSNHTYNKATVIHETMHSLGYLHEQARPDRDNYVVIQWENIEEGREHNFEKILDWGWTGYTLGEFDYNSIMIYSSDSFVADGRDYTITKLDGSLITQGSTLSNNDIASLNFIYGPKPNLATTRTYYSDNSDAYSIDKDSRYSNVVTFVNSDNEPIVLTYPRLLVVRYYLEYQIGPQETNRNVIDTTECIVVPAGVSRYELPETRCFRQEDMGIIREYQEEFYSVYVY